MERANQVQNVGGDVIQVGVIYQKKLTITHKQMYSKENSKT